MGVCSFLLWSGNAAMPVHTQHLKVIAFDLLTLNRDIVKIS